MIHPRCCSTTYCGEEKSLPETGPMRSQNCCCWLNISEPAMSVEARRRVRKSRGEHAVSMHSDTAMRLSFLIHSRVGIFGISVDLRL